MIVLDEGDLRLHVSDVFEARKFDGPKHGLSHCMKAVDFIVENDDVAYLIEFKDPDSAQAQANSVDAFMKEFQSGKLIDKLVSKFRDTFIYRYATGELDKPVVYLVLLQSTAIGPAEFSSQTERLKQKLPLHGPKDVPWQRPFVHQCMILNIERWNGLFPNFTVSRISAA
jgi:hypothetical protein